MTLAVLPLIIAVIRGNPACVRNDPVVVRSISATRLSVLCPANAGRYFAAVAGSPDFILKLVADNEVGRVNPKIPEMKENIRPASARPDKPETTAVAGLLSTNRHELLARLGKGDCLGGLIPRSAK